MSLVNLWNYYIGNIDNIDYNASDGKSFKYKTKIAGKTLVCPGNEGDVNQSAVPNLNLEFTILLKYISRFRRFLDLSLINYETELDLSWGKDCIDRTSQ